MSSQESIRPDLPPAMPESASAADPLRQATFLARLRQIMEAHQAAVRSQADPALAGTVRVVSVLVGLAVGWAAAKDLTGKDALGVVVCVCIACACVPDMLFWMLRRQRLTRAIIALDDQIDAVVRLFPDEAEKAGGLPVLSDHVELEALVNVLQEEVRNLPVPNTYPHK